MTPTCIALTKDGKPCTNPAKRYAKKCGAHTSCKPTTMTRHYRLKLWKGKA